MKVTSEASRSVARKPTSQSLKFHKGGNEVHNIQKLNKSITQQLTPDKRKPVRLSGGSGFLSFSPSLSLKNNNTAPRKSDLIKQQQKKSASNPHVTAVLPGGSVASLGQLKQFAVSQSSADNLSVKKKSIEDILLNKWKAIFSVSQDPPVRINEEIIIGMNSISSEITKRNNLSVVVINKDWKKELIQLLVELCNNKNHIPVVLVDGSFFTACRAVINVKSINCFGIRKMFVRSEKMKQIKSSVIREDVESLEMNTTNLRMKMSALIDDLRDFLIDCNMLGR
jgi:ribosomal protein L7Ae-like RNA K-turn-binding protein